jgi:GGDEF domain-containing protein
MKLWVLILAAGLAATTSAAAAPAHEPLFTVAEVRTLSHEEASRHLPVDIEATVTYFRGYEKTLFVQEGEVGVYVSATSGLRLQPGDVIRVRGTTSDSFNPIIVSNDITLLGHGKLPEPLPVLWPSLARADYDCRWVKVHGKVVLAQMGSTSGQAITRLLLRMEGGTAEIVMDNNDPARIKGLQDAEVEIAAVAGETFDGKMQQTGVRLHVPSFDYVQVLKRSPADPWSTPATPMDKVFGGEDIVDNTPRVRVEGTLTYYRQNEMAVLQDGNRSIRVLTREESPLRIGDRVEVLGAPFVEKEFLTLKLGQIRSDGPGPPVTPQLVNWDDVASGKYSFDLISIEGTIVSQVQEYAQDVYVISTGQHLFSATLRHSFSFSWPPGQKLPPMRQIPVGSRVRVTGVASLESGNSYNGPIAFTLLLRSAGDIATVAGPPLLNVRHLIELVGVLLLVVFAVSVRAWLIERGARRKIASMAYLEQRRARILELINHAHPLAEILRQITELVSASLGGAPSWCQVTDGARIGNSPPNLPSSSLRVVDHSIPSRSAAPLGAVSAAFDARTKPQHAETAALSTAAGLAALAIETSRLYSDLVYRSEFDLLTDVQNRFSLEKFIDKQIESAHQSARMFGLLYVDLDEFKQVNDRFGHHVGDMYLQEVARRMKHQLRPGDMLARLGGDEFAALAPLVRSRAEVEDRTPPGALLCRTIPPGRSRSARVCQHWHRPLS